MSHQSSVLAHGREELEQRERQLQQVRSLDWPVLYAAPVCTAVGLCLPRTLERLVHDALETENIAILPTDNP